MEKLELEFNQEEILDEAFRVRDKNIYLIRTVISLLGLWEEISVSECDNSKIFDPNIDDAEYLGNVFGVGQLNSKGIAIETDYKFDSKKIKTLSKLKLLGYKNCYLIDDTPTFAVGEWWNRDEYEELKVPEKTIDFHFIQDSPLDCIKLNSINFYGRQLEGTLYESVSKQASQKFSREITASNFLWVRDSRKLRLNAIGTKYVRVNNTYSMRVLVKEAQCYAEFAENTDLLVNFKSCEDSVINISNCKTAVVKLTNCKNCIMLLHNCGDVVVESFWGNTCLIHAHSSKYGNKLSISRHGGSNHLYTDKYDFKYLLN